MTSTIKLQSPGCSENCAVVIGLMKGNNLTLVNNTIEAVLTTTSQSDAHYAALLCGKLSGGFVNMTNNTIKPSTLVTTLRGAMISSYLENSKSVVLVDKL